MKRFVVTLFIVFVIIAAAGTAAAAAATEEELKSLLRAETSGNILAFSYYDYDADGTKEAFAFVGEGSSDDYSGEFWFVNENGARKIMENSWYLEINNVKTIGSHKFAVLSENYTTADIAHIWGVRNGAPQKENISGLGGSFWQVDDKNLTLTRSAYDGMTDGTGHTWKKYYFYWDESKRSFHEYGGLAISVDQLLKCNGAKSIIDEIKKTGGVIGEIFYRANNVININYLTGEDNNNATLLLENSSVRLISLHDWSETDLGNSNDGGVYEAAMIPKIATYPNEFPVK